MDTPLQGARFQRVNHTELCSSHLVDEAKGGVDIACVHQAAHRKAILLFESESTKNLLEGAGAIRLLLVLRRLNVPLPR